MKPDKFTEAHSNKNFNSSVTFCENNSLSTANACPAGICVSSAILISNESSFLKEIIHQEVTEIEKIAEKGIVIIATGPLTSEGLSKEISKITGEDKLHFYDAAAPIVTKESIDFNIAFFGNRYEQEKGKDETIDDWKERLHKQEASYLSFFKFM